MLKLLPILLLPMLIFAAEPEFYLWRRQNSPAVEQAVAEFYRQSKGALYFLAGELENNGKVISVPPAPMVKFDRATAVIRIHIRHLSKAPAQLAAEIAKLYSPWQKCKKLQIDLDCQERKLDYYPALMVELRKLLPAEELSATVLPCHLSHTKNFTALARSCDYFVLQIHGLHQQKGKWQIIDKKAVIKAWNQAIALKRPFKTAIPLYCSFVGNQTILPDFDFTAKLAKIAADHGGTIGFRLGVSGERDTLDLHSAMKLCSGEKPVAKISARWEKHPSGTWHLFITSAGDFARKVTIPLSFPPEMKISDLDTFGQAFLSVGRDSLTLELPPAGKEIPCLWLRLEKDFDLNKFNPFITTIKKGTANL